MDGTLLRVVVAVGVVIYSFIWVFYLGPRLARIKWINKLFNLGGKHPIPDRRYSGWNWLYFGIIIMILGVIFIVSGL